MRNSNPDHGQNVQGNGTSLANLGQLVAIQVHTWIGKEGVTELNIQKVPIDDHLAPMMLFRGQSALRIPDRETM